MNATRVRKRPAAPRARAGKRAAGELQRQWSRLHQGDREPWPDAKLVGRWEHGNAALAAEVRACGGAAAVSEQLQGAWQQFHAGEFVAAIRQAVALGALGAAVANKAAAVQTLYRADGDAEHVLNAAVDRGEAAVKLLDEHANTHYTLALVLGRYSQRISILAAVAQGFAGRVRSHLQRAIELQPQHAEAHVALGLYHAELLNKLGSLAASLSFGASANAALEHFHQALKLAPDSPIVQMEYANGLLLLDRKRHTRQAQELYQQVAALEPMDAMERMDIERAQRGLSG